MQLSVCLSYLPKDVKIGMHAPGTRTIVWFRPREEGVREQRGTPGIMSTLKFLNKKYVCAVGESREKDVFTCEVVTETFVQWEPYSQSGP